jgi:hypothetical protein
MKIALLNNIAGQLYVWGMILLKMSIIRTVFRFAASHSLRTFLWVCLMLMPIIGLAISGLELLRCRPYRAVYDFKLLKDGKAKCMDQYDYQKALYACVSSSSSC